MAEVYDIFADALGDVRPLLASDAWPGLGPAERPRRLTVGGLAAHLTMAVKALIGVFEARELASPELRAAAPARLTRRTAAPSWTPPVRGPRRPGTEMSRWVQDKAATDAAKGRDVVLDRFDRGMPDIVALLGSVPRPRGDSPGQRGHDGRRLRGDPADRAGGPRRRPGGQRRRRPAALLRRGNRRRAGHPLGLGAPGPGDMAVIRSLTRAERADPEVLRAL